MNYEAFLTAIYTAVLSGFVVSLLQLIILPRLEQKKMRFQETWKAKRDAFVEALQLLDRHFSSAKWSGPDIPDDYRPSQNKPLSADINKSVVQLSLLSDNIDIPKKFVSFFAKGSKSSPADRGEFI